MTSLRLNMCGASGCGRTNGCACMYVCPQKKKKKKLVNNLKQFVMSLWKKKDSSSQRFLAVWTCVSLTTQSRTLILCNFFFMTTEGLTQTHHTTLPLVHACQRRVAMVPSSAHLLSINPAASVYTCSGMSSCCVNTFCNF